MSRTSTSARRTTSTRLSYAIQRPESREKTESLACSGGLVAGGGEYDLRDRPIAGVSGMGIAGRAGEGQSADAGLLASETALWIENRKGVGETRPRTRGHPSDGRFERAKEWVGSSEIVDVEVPDPVTMISAFGAPARRRRRMLVKREANCANVRGARPRTQAKLPKQVSASSSRSLPPSVSVIGLT